MQLDFSSIVPCAVELMRLEKEILFWDVLISTSLPKGTSCDEHAVCSAKQVVGSFRRILREITDPFRKQKKLIVGGCDCLRSGSYWGASRFCSACHSASTLWKNAL